MPYREPPPDRLDAMIHERVTQLVAEIAHIDREIGAWAALLGEGADAPEEVIELASARARFEQELRRIASRVTARRPA